MNATTQLPDGIISWAAMEMPPKNGRTDFSDKNAFMRDDPTNDAEFYATPRKLIHIDGTCASRIAAFYAEMLEPGAHVLDLMSGWRSHLPKNSGSVIGLGMNEAEMADNSQLDFYLIHDLNQNVVLPFEDNEFDIVVNTVSIEYLIRPIEVLKEVRRILKPGGKFVITFSNRYFPTKAIYLWKNIHPVERLGWVLQNMEEAGFINMKSRIERGLARDPTDRYANKMKEMDPLFAISAQKPD